MPHPRVTLPILLSGIAAATTPAYAQDVDSTSGKAAKARSSLIEEVVVTAQKREQSVQDVAIAINAFSGDTLKALGVTDTADLGALVPGFSYSNSGYGSPVYTLRGVGFTDASYTASSTVGVYVDEINIPFSVMTKGANLDIERVEVLKGPQGILYGRNTTGGAINYIANKPTALFEAGMELTRSRFETTQIEGYVSGPLGDNVKGRLSVLDINSTEGWQYSITRRGTGEDEYLGKQDRMSARLSLEWQLSDRIFQYFVVSYSDDYGEPQAPQAIEVQEQNPFGMGTGLTLAPEVRSHPLVPKKGANARASDWALYRDRDMASQTNKLHWQNNEYYWSAALRTEWEISDNVMSTTLLNYQGFEIDDSFLPQNGLSVANVERMLNAEIYAWSAESRLSGLWGQGNNWVAGVFVSKDDVVQNDVLFLDNNSATIPDPTNTLLPNVLGDTATVFGDQVADTLAIFGNTEFVISSTLTASVGARYTTEERIYKGCTAGGPDNIALAGFAATFNAVSITRGGLGGGSEGECFTLNPKNNNNTGEVIRPDALEEDNLSGRVALNWTPVDDQLYYVSYSRGFKSGSFPVVSASDGSQLDSVTQEQLDAYEIGGKTTLFDGSLRFNFAGFYYEYEDKQLLTRFQDPLFGPLPILDNAPESEVTGVEIDLQYSPTANLYFSLAAAYTTTEVLEFVSIDESGATRDFAGNEFNFTPNLNYTALINYDYPIFDRYKLTFGADYTYTGETNAVLGNDDAYAMDDYYNVNVRLGFGDVDGLWSVTAFSRNATDEFQTVSLFDPGDVVARYAGMPRVNGVTLKLNYW